MKYCFLAFQNLSGAGDRPAPGDSAAWRGDVKNWNSARVLLTVGMSRLLEALPQVARVSSDPDSQGGRLYHAR